MSGSLSVQVGYDDPEHRWAPALGATVTVRTVSGERTGDERRLTIVGVDEADAANGRVAFVAPIARALLGCEVGEIATLQTPRGEELLEVVSVDDGAE